MERLTYFDNGYWRLKWKGCEYSAEWVNRLAAYEDTGLEPEEIIEAENRHHDCKIDCLLQKYNELAGAVNDLGGLDHLRELVQADKDGLLMVLPCKAGSYVWVDGREAIVEKIFGYKTERYLHAQFYDNMQYIDIPFAEIGKTVFLTREEVEAALKGGDST